MPEEDRTEVGTIVIGIKLLAPFEEAYHKICKWSSYDLVSNFEEPLCKHGYEYNLDREDPREGDADKDEGIQSLTHQC